MLNRQDRLAPRNGNSSDWQLRARNGWPQLGELRRLFSTQKQTRPARVAIPKSANKRRVRSAEDLSASTGSRRLRGTRFAGTPDLRWRSPINLSEHRIESPQATEACAHGDLRNREIGLVQKPLRPLHACRLGDLNRACTEVHLEEPGQMSRADPETIGQSLDTAVIKCTVRDEPERTFDSGACSLPCRRERSSLRPAPQTRSETRKLGRRCRRIEHYVGRLGRAHRTDRAAVDTCRANARKEQAVEATIPPNACPFAFFDIEHRVPRG